MAQADSDEEHHLSHDSLITLNPLNQRPEIMSSLRLVTAGHKGALHPRRRQLANFPVAGEKKSMSVLRPYVYDGIPTYSGSAGPKLPPTFMQIFSSEYVVQIVASITFRDQ